jgi:hypothetical protein
MAEEPPGDFINFVAARLPDLQREAARLTGGPQHADEIYPAVLSDVAGHWRRLCWRSRLVQRDAAGEFLARRLAARAKQWREEQIYEVEVQLLRPPSSAAVATLPASYALRKAALLPDTQRVQHRPVAEAAIAWTRAWRRANWHRYARVAAAIFLILVAFLQAVPTST